MKRWTDLHLSSLKYFVDAVHVGSLTSAAELNFVSRPAVSQAIRRLESHLGYDLLEHKKKSFTLTEKGQSFYVKATVALKAFNQSLDEAQGSDGLRLACSSTIAEFLVLPLLKKFKQRDSIRIRIGTSQKVREWVESGDAALGLLIDDGLTVGFQTHVVKRGHFAFYSKTGRWEHPLWTTENRPEVVAGLKALDFPSPRIQIESWNMNYKAAITLGGSCLLPDIIPVEKLKKIPIKSFNFQYEVTAITKNKNDLLPFERALFTGLKSS